jgi:hypothetical protein
MNAFLIFIYHAAIAGISVGVEIKPANADILRKIGIQCRIEMNYVVYDCLYLYYCLLYRLRTHTAD